MRERPPTMETTQLTRTQRLAALGGMLALVTLLHLSTPVDQPLLHQIWRRLYYMPILFGAWWYGLRGGLVTAVLSALLYLPHILIHWAHTPPDNAGRYGEMIMYFVVGAITGVLADLEHRQHRRYQEAAAELEQAYAQLQDSMEQIRRADRLSAAGQLAAGMAHEIRNPLGSIKSAVDLLLDDIPDDLPSQEFADIISKETRRLQHLLDDFLSFARPSPPSFGPVDLRRFIPQVLRLLNKEAERNKADLSYELPAAIEPVQADEAQLSQVLVNLVLNAIQAQEEGGRVEIEVEEDPGEERVRIHVKDDGPGIASSVKEKLFDPFFTTRKEGTGLGLSVAYAIIEAHGGTIRAEDRPEGGADFVLSLPVWAGGTGHE
ncbi:MAG: ATP-binding protein [bacterium]